MNFANIIFAAFATLSLGLLLWQWLAARRFPLHRRTTQTDFTPAVTLLKPLKGCDDATADSLRSWFKQSYTGPIQILFGVADAKDPVVPVIQQLLAEHPGADAQLVICENLIGSNAKVAKLVQLEALAKHELILISDADVRIPADFLQNIVLPWRNKDMGLVNCFYRLANPVNAAMQCEAVAINADFWSQVLQSQTLKPLDFALGAAMLTSRTRLKEIGGFAALADCLADDYQLGYRIARKGHLVVLSTMVVECWDPPMNWRQVWRHQLRWARTIRVSQPVPYFFSILANAGQWSLFWLAVSLITSSWSISPIVLGYLLVRIYLAQDLQRRLTPGGTLVSPFWLVLTKDLLQTAVWLGAFAGNTIEWRGRKMRLRRDGKLEAV